MNGLETYHSFYTGVFGDRWPALRAALEADAYHVARANKFQPVPSDKHARWGVGAPYPHLPNCYEVNAQFSLNNFAMEPLFPFYKMDPASIFAARALDVQEGDSVLDMCAAPGGKTLVLCEGMGNSGHLIANELSDKRRFRMMSVLKQYLPPERRAQVDVYGHDSTMYGLKKPDTFDRILLDAPCSSDRARLLKPSELEGWTPKRSKNFAIRQYSLLASAFMSLKSGGTLVYSTCSISEHENDGVIDKLFKKKNGEFEVLRTACPIGENTRHGQMILPDRDKAGPIYFGVIKKL